MYQSCYLRGLVALILSLAMVASSSMSIDQGLTDFPQELSSDGNPVSALTEDAPKSLATQIHQVLGKDIPVWIKTDTQESWWSPRNGLSFLAIVLSVLSFCYSVFSQRRSRRQSVNDEFWLRKVAYPLVIEPIVNTFTQTVLLLPLDSAAKKAVGNALPIGQFCSEFQDQLEQRRGTLMLLAAAVDQTKATQIYQRMLGSLEQLEDTVVIYCHELEDAIKNGRRPKFKREATIQRIQSALTQFLQPIREWQHAA